MQIIVWVWHSIRISMEILSRLPLAVAILCLGTTVIPNRCQALKLPSLIGTGENYAREIVSSRASFVIFTVRTKIQ